MDKNQGDGSALIVQLVLVEDEEESSHDQARRSRAGFRVCARCSNSSHGDLVLSFIMITLYSHSRSAIQRAHSMYMHMGRALLHADTDISCP
jgi:hypothetical protein